MKSLEESSSLILGLITALLSLQMPIGTFRAAGTGCPPYLGVFLMILSGVFLLNILLVRKKEPGKKESQTRTPGSPWNLILFLGAMALATLFFNRLGYPLISFLLMVALLRILGTKDGPSYLLSLVTATASYFLFVDGSRSPCPKGGSESEGESPMIESLQGLINGFGVATTIQNLFYCVMGAIVGTLVGVLPGLGPIAGIALLIPATFGLNPPPQSSCLPGFIMEPCMEGPPPPFF